MGKTYGQHGTDSCAGTVDEIEDNRLVPIEQGFEMDAFPVLIHQGHIRDPIFFNCPFIFCRALDLAGQQKKCQQNESRYNMRGSDSVHIKFLFKRDHPAEDFRWLPLK